jgi:hypothetical protein
MIGGDFGNTMTRLRVVQNYSHHWCFAGEQVEGPDTRGPSTVA